MLGGFFYYLEVREFLADEKRFAWLDVGDFWCVWVCGSSLVGGSLPTPGPGDTDAGMQLTQF